MSSRDRQFIHPFSFFLIEKGVDRTHEMMTASSSISKGDAMKNCCGFWHGLKKKSKKT